MFQRDYILRIIDQFIRILAELIFKRKQDADQDVIDQVFSTSTDLFGLDFHMLDMIKTDALISFLESGNDDQFKLYAYAMLFKEISYAQYLEGFKQKALVSLRKAIGLLDHFLAKKDGPDKLVLIEHVEDMADWALLFQLQDDYLLKLFYICFKLKRFHKAENLLFRLGELSGREIEPIGLHFFETVLAQSEEYLLNCGLNRAEFEQSCQDFKQVVKRKN
ncbi:MAG: hypothetical protein KDD94_00295 [Calditrichaeota bacterium]|nr:hypothetical protein [Calditrichota bacterium]